MGFRNMPEMKPTNKPQFAGCGFEFEGGVTPVPTKTSDLINDSGFVGMSTRTYNNVSVPSGENIFVIDDEFPKCDFIMGMFEFDNLQYPAGFVLPSYYNQLTIQEGKLYAATKIVDSKTMKITVYYKESEV